MSKEENVSSPTIVARFVTTKLAFWIVMLAGLVFDIATKAWATRNVRPEGWDPNLDTPVIPVIEGFLSWKWAANLGAAFSILEGRADALSLIAFLVLVAVLFYVLRADPRRKFFLAALGLVASGAVGNLYDRLWLGYVRDFIYFDFDLPLHGTLSFVPRRWPVFNVADMAIIVGVVVLMLQSFFAPPPRKKAAAPAEDGDGA